MKYLTGLFFLVLFGLGMAYGFYSSTPTDAFVGKCYTSKVGNAYLDLVKVKVDKIRDDGKYNVVIYFTPEPQTAQDFLLQARVLEFNDSWADANDLKTLIEVNCD